MLSGALSLALLSAAGASQDRDIQVSGHAGWGGIVARGDWAPALVDVDNRGDKDRDVVLVLAWAFAGSNQSSAAPGLGGLSGRTGPSHHLPLTVAARSRKRVSAAVLAPDQDRMSVWVYATPPKGGRALAMAELPTRSVEPGRRFVAAVGTDLPGGFPPAANDLARILPEALPEDWRAYAGLDALLWLDGRPAEIRSQAQAEALRTWVSAGGRLVVARATEAGLPGSALAELLPVAVRGTVTLDGLELGGKRAEGRVAVLETAPRGNARILEKQGDLPLAVDRNVDGGRVTFVAFDPSARPFDGWEGAPLFWSRLLGPPPPAPPDQPGQMRAPRVVGSLGLAQVAGRFPDVEPPAIGWLFVLIVAYLLVVGPLDYFVLRSFRKLELTWFTFPAYVAGFTLFILAAGGAFIGRAAYQRELAVIDHHAESGFSRHRALSALLAPTDLVYSIADAEPLSSNFTPRALFQDLSDKLSETRIAHGRETRAQGWILNRSHTGLAASDRCGRAPAPVAWTVEGLQAGRLRVSLRNSGPATYSEARLVAADGVFDLGEIPPGTRTIEALRVFPGAADYVRAEGPEPGGAYGYYGGEGQISERDLNAQVRRWLLGLSLAPPAAEPLTGFARGLDARAHLESGGSVLLAWTHSDEPQVSFDPFPNRRSGIQLTRFFGGPLK